MKDSRRLLVLFATAFLIPAAAGLQPAPLQAQEEEGDTVVITAEREESTPTRTAPGVTLITREEIAASGAVDTGQLLDQLAGIKTERTGGALSPLTVSIRGSGSERILVLLDGKPLPGGDLSLVSPERIDHIEILKGSSSADEGSGAVGGVIRITTRQDIPPTGLRGEFRSSLGSWGFRELAASASGESGLLRPFSWRAGLSALAEDALYGFDSDGGIVLRENAGGERYSGYGGAEWLIDPDREIGAALTAEGSWTDRGAPGTVDFPTIEARQTDLNLSGTLTGYWRAFPLFGIEGSFSGGYRCMTYTDPGYLLGEIDEFHETVPLSADLSLDRQDTWKHWSLASRLEGSWTRESLVSTALTGQDGSEGSGRPLRNALGITLSETAVIGPVSLSPTLRYDTALIEAGDIRRSDSRFSFSLGILYTPAPTVSVKGRAGTGYRLPSFSDLFWPSTAFAVGNPDLEPEESLSYEVGLTAELLPGWFIELTHFNSLITGMIQWNPGPGGTWRPENLGRASLSGFEGETRVTIPLPGIQSALTLRGSYGLLLARDLTEGSSTYDKTLPRRPVEQASASAGLIHTRGHFLNIEARYTGYRYTNAQNTAMIPSSLVLDCSGGVRFAADWELRLSVTNLLDEPYVDTLEYPVPGRSIRLTLLFTPEARP